MKGRTFSPTEIIFAATNACNLHCEHCFIQRNPHKLEIADAVRLIESCVKAGSDIDRIGFSGGEPFLYMDFLIEVTKAAIANDLMFDQIMTNGDWWREESDLCETLQKLYDAGYDGKIGLSWDSYHGQTTDRMETFIRAVQEVFGEDSINIQTVDAPGALRGVNSEAVVKPPVEGVADKPTKRSESSCTQERFEERLGLGARGRLPPPEFPSGISVYHLPRTFTSDDARAWNARRWFREDYCEGPGHILYVHADGNIAPCCGFANENPALFIGRITDSFEKIMQNAAENKMIKICYEEGLSHYRRHGLKKNLRARKEKLAGRTNDICTFCDFVCKKI